MYLVAIELLLAHLAINVAEDPLFRRKEDLHEVAGQMIHWSGRRPGRDYVWTWQEISIR